MTDVENSSLHSMTVNGEPSARAVVIHPEKLDIEHTFVNDDPRQWCRARKVCLIVPSKIILSSYFSRTR